MELRAAQFTVRSRNTARGRWAAKERDRAQLSIVDVDEPVDWTTDDWATPWPLIHELAQTFGAFDLDPCATPATAKAPKFYTREDDGLAQPWRGVIFCNPPYSEVARWLEKAYQEVQAGRAQTVVCLIPVRTDQAWWHEKVWGRGEVWWIRGRLHFIGKDGTTIGRPVFASCLAIYAPEVTVNEP